MQIPVNRECMNNVTHLMQRERECRKLEISSHLRDLTCRLIDHARLGFMIQDTEAETVVISGLTLLKKKKRLIVSDYHENYLLRYRIHY